MKLIQLAITATAFTFAAPTVMGEEATTELAATQTLVTAKVKGMVCDFCARAVTKVFSKNDAVENVHVDLDTQEIHVTLKTGGELTDDTVGELVKKSGYTLVSIDRETV